MQTIYCDGSCRGNPGPGGWGVYVQATGEEYYGHNPDTTNNQMELTAAINALKLVVTDCTIYTDSNYVIKGITEWIHGWRKNNWKSTKGAVKNKELWVELDKLNSAKRVSWQWVKGHSTDPGNIRADKLANLGADGKNKFVPDLTKKSTKDVAVTTPFDISPGDILETLKDQSLYYVFNVGQSCLLVSFSNTAKLEYKMVSFEAIYKSCKKATVTTAMRQNSLAILNTLISDSQRAIEHLKNDCPHFFQENGDGSYAARCTICKTYFGHLCSESPDQVCHYFATQVNGTLRVKLTNGTYVNAPSDYDSGYASEDECIYCGAPQERK